MTTLQRWIKEGFDEAVYDAIGEEKAKAILDAIPDEEPPKRGFRRTAADDFPEFEGMKKADALNRLLVKDYYDGSEEQSGGSLHHFVFAMCQKVTAAYVARDAFAMFDAMTDLVWQIKATSGLSKLERRLLPQLERFVRDYNPASDPLHFASKAKHIAETKE